MRYAQAEADGAVASVVFSASGKADTLAEKTTDATAARRRLSFVFVTEDCARRRERQGTRRLNSDVHGDLEDERKPPDP